MPTKRTRRTRGRTPPLNLYNLELHAILCFWSWSPPHTPLDWERARWTTWADYLADWSAVREEAREDETFAREWPPFAERLRLLYGAKGPPAAFDYDDVQAALATADEADAAALLADVDIS